MRVAVIGAGIVGVTTAFELGRDGHEVDVFERRSAIAEESSFSPAGIQSPALVRPQAVNLHAPGRARQMLTPGEGLRLRWPLSLADAGWLWHSRRTRRSAADAEHKAALRTLALYSRSRQQALRAQLGLEYERSDGLLYLLRTERDHRRAQPWMQGLSEAGIPFGQLDADQARRIEPALDTRTPLAGAVHLPDDEAGNCRQFALLLRNAAIQCGVRFHFQAAVRHITLTPRPALRWQGSAEESAFDAVVVCAGVGSAALLAPLGLRPKLAAVHAYALNASIREPLNAPRSAIVDHHHQIAICRLGQRVRVSGYAELGGDASTRHPGAVQALYRVLHDWFPGAALKDATVQEWKGSFATLADGPPLVTPGGHPGLWLNLGHGTSHWALACGSARVLADMLLGHAPEIDVRGLALGRSLAG